MSISPVSNVGYYNAVNFKGGSVDPTKDKIYIDSKTGEKTTWQPGLYDPEAEAKVAKAKKRLKLLAFGVVGGALAFIFRGKIKSGIELIKGFFKK